MEVTTKTEGVGFKPITLTLEVKVQTAEDYAQLVEEGVRFSQDDGIISDTEGVNFPTIMEVSKSLFNSLKMSPTKEGEKQQS